MILLNTIPETVDDSWYQVKPMRSLKILATNPSSALRHSFFNSNVSEIWPTETASDSLKTYVTKKLICQELTDILPSCKKHWKAYLILL